MNPGFEKIKPFTSVDIHTNKQTPKDFYSMHQLEAQIFRYKDQKELTIRLFGDYLLSLRAWKVKPDKPPQEWNWSAFLSQENCKNGVMLRISKDLFLENILDPREFYKEHVKNPIIHRVSTSMQTRGKCHNHNLFYLIEPGFR